MTKLKTSLYQPTELHCTAHNCHVPDIVACSENNMI